MTEQQLAVMRQWAENVSKAYDLTAWGHTERAAEILRQTRDAIHTAIKQAEQPQCNWPNCPYPCPDLPDCKDAEQQPIIKNKIKKDNSEQQPAHGQHDMPKLGCVNHDCDKCKAAEKQEPVAYDKTEINCFAQDLYDQKMREGKRGHYESMFHVIHQCIKKVSPPANANAGKPWVGLTDEEVEDLYFDGFSMSELKQFARAIEAKLREKNTPQQSKGDA